MLFDNVERVLNEDQQINAPIPSLRTEWRHFERENPFDSMSDRKFWSIKIEIMLAEL